MTQFVDINPKAEIGKDVKIGSFVTIGENVTIGDGCEIFPHATILPGARIGKNCRIFPNAIISGIPQDLKFKGEETIAEIGDNTTIRECATVNRGTASKGKTTIGKNCLVMAYSHIAHDCRLGDNVIIGNASQIAGEVQIEDWAILSGGSLVHQFTKIGAHVMIQGGSRLGQDIPPYVMAGREPICYMGINIVGLKRRNFTAEQINEISNIYKTLYLSGLNTTQAIEKIETDFEESDIKENILSFLKNADRGILRAAHNK